MGVKVNLINRLVGFYWVGRFYYGLGWDLRDLRVWAFEVVCDGVVGLWLIVNLLGFGLYGSLIFIYKVRW